MGFPKVKYLVNWTQATDCCGGSERRYSNLKRSFPKAELVSAQALTRSDCIQTRREAVDNFLKENTDKNDIVIKDAGVGGISEIKAKTILIFGNPYSSLLKLFPNKPFAGAWKELVQAQIQDSEKSALNVANSNFTKHDAKVSEIRIDKVIPNGVDTDFWVPSQSAKRYPLWVGSAFKEKSINLRLNDFPNLLKVYKRFKCSKEKMLTFYQNAFCFIHPFPVEGNCNAVLEAMACNLPIISTKSGWFWDKSLKEVGHEYENITSALDKAYEILYQTYETKEIKINSRKYLIDNGLTLTDYIKNMKGVLQCLH